MYLQISLLGFGTELELLVMNILALIGIVYNSTKVLYTNSNFIEKNQTLKFSKNR